LSYLRPKIHQTTPETHTIDNIYANAAHNSTIYTTASQIKRIGLYASTADDMT